MSRDVWRNAVVLVTGATGSFGQAFVRFCLADLGVATVRLYSRDEDKQRLFAATLTPEEQERCRFLLGDVRDRDRLTLAMHGADVVVHAAALKRVDSLVYDPVESIRTNILGSLNVMHAALDAGVARVIGISTDKATKPTNLYGATKMAMEHIFRQGNVYAGTRRTRLACVRYGNVLGSRGSVLPLWREQVLAGRPLTLTHPDMTRYWLPLGQAVRFVAHTASFMEGGETCIPPLARSRVTTMAEAYAGMDYPMTFTGIRPGGEKLHEDLLSDVEARAAWQRDDGTVVIPPVDRPAAEAYRERLAPRTSADPPLLTVEECRAVLRESDLDGDGK